jgi:hypothetical protein
MDIYSSHEPWPKDVRVAALRIVRIYPRANTVWMCKPDVGVATESLVRGVVGVVPVEPDGSVRFEAPADTLVYFPALAANGRAIQTMRSGTYIQPGAHVTCLGCHEPKHRAPPILKQQPLAMLQPVRKPEPGPAGSDPVFFPALVQPILDRHCVSCHSDHIQGRQRAERMPPDLSPIPDTRRGPAYDRQGAVTLWNLAYRNLVRYTGRNFGGKPVKYEGRTAPGSFGALNSRLYPLLADGSHHRVKLSAEELRTLAVWMDLNSNFLGHYLFTEEQSRGILPAPPPATYFDVSDHPEARIPIVLSSAPTAEAVASPARPGAAQPAITSVVPAATKPPGPEVQDLDLNLKE